MHFTDHMSGTFTSFSICFLFLFTALHLLFVTPVPADETAGMDTVLVLDVSGSMVHTDPDGLCRQAAKDYLAALGTIPGRRAGRFL